MRSRLPLWGAEGTDAVVNDSPVGCQSRGVTESWVAGSAGSAAADETGGFDAQRRRRMRSFFAPIRIFGSEWHITGSLIEGAVSRLRLTEGVSYAEFFLRQICGFAGLFIVLSIISGTPLSLLVQRKLQRSTRRRGERNLPALRSTPLRAESILFRLSAAAHAADLPALLMKCFVLEN